jgi:limonene-1,2-epoxide hydrolase
MKARQVLEKWVELFNQADAEKISQLYTEDATNHQVAQEPIQGKKNIQKMFEQEFVQAKTVCIVENIFEDGEWAIFEWKDPFGLRGCGFFKVQNGKIVFQRGYWDKLSFLRQHKLPLPTD